MSFAAADLPPRRQAPGGAWDCAGVFARDGVQIYEDEQGQPVREARPRSEVMRSAAAMAGLVLTLQHPGDGQDPDGGKGEVTPENARALWHGSVLECTPDWPSDGLMGGWVRASTADLQCALEQGTVECSVGYTATLRDPRDPEMAALVAELGPEPGVTHDGQRYDLIQTQIEPNHLAIVDQARAGPVARLRLDGRVMKTKIQINGKTHEVAAFLAKAIRSDALDATAQTKAKTDALEVGEIVIEGQTLVLPKSTIDQILVMLGGSAGPSAAAPPPGDAAMPPPGEGMQDPLVADAEDEDMPKPKADALAATVRRLVQAEVAKLAPATAQKIADSVLTTSRERAALEREASLVLGMRHDYAGQDDHAVAVAVLKAAESPRFSRAEQLAQQARKGDTMAAGRLRQMMDDVLDARRDAQDSTSDLAFAVFSASEHQSRQDGTTDDEPEHKRRARERRDARLNPKTGAAA